MQKLLIIEPNIGEVTFSLCSGKGDDFECEAVSKSADELRGREAFGLFLRGLLKKGRPDAVCFRMLFGGDAFKKPVLINEDFYPGFRKLVHFFPFYIPAAEEMARSCQESVKDMPVLAFFETSFFADLPEEEKYYALPHGYFSEENIKRWGFDGISHDSNARSTGRDKVISLVLDRKTTVCAVSRGKPVLISLGFTPLEGIMGRTSCGDLDPGIVFYLMRRYKMTVFEIDNVLKKQSGFYGLTGYDAAIEELAGLYGKDPKVDLAFDIFLNQILKYIGEGISVMGGLDSIAVSGAGLNGLAPFLYRILKRISFLGITEKELPWDKEGRLIRVTSDDSTISVFLNRTPVPVMLYEKARDFLSNK